MSKSTLTPVTGLSFRLNAMLRPALGLSIMAISALSLGLFADASFGASYHVAPRIAPRDRGTLPKTMSEPRIDLETAPAKAKSSETRAYPDPATEIPAVTVEITKVVAPPKASSSQSQPVANSAEVTTAKAAGPAETPASPSHGHTVSAPTKTGHPDEAAKPKTVATEKAPSPKPITEEKTRKVSHGKKQHPIVVAPEPLLPSEIDVRTAGVPEPSGGRSYTQPIQAAPKTASGNTAKPLNVQQSENDSLSRSDRETKTTESFNDAEMKRFLTSTPQKAVYTDPANQSSRNNGWEPGFYPVGYTPAVRPVTPERVQALGDALSHYNRGVYYTQRKQWNAAIQEYKQVLSKNANMADAYVGLSTAAVYQRDWENALKNSVKALRFKSGFLDPANITQARYNLSSVYCVSNDYHKALRYFKQVQKDNHPEADALWTFLQSNCKP